MFAPSITLPKPPPTTVTVLINEPTTAMVTPAAVRQALPTPRPGLVMKTAPARPEGWTPPIDSGTVPETPKTFPTDDVSMSSVRAETPEDAHRVALPQQTGTGTASGSASAVVPFDFQQMRILHRVDPVYPPLAKMAKIQGEVILLMAVDPRGVPTDVKALSGPHPSLEQEAMRIARLWRFEPASLNGQPVTAQFRLTIVFRLR
jgi:protein TonB